MADAQITVVGTGEVVAEPDRVELALELSAIEKTADEALTDAAALGGACGAVIRVAEPGTGPTHHGPELAVAAAAGPLQRSMRAGHEVPELDLAPARIPVHARVEVTFAFVPG